MSNIVFELFAKLGLDSSEYEKGLEGAKGKASTIGGAIGKGLATVGKVGAAALGAATTAVSGFALSSVNAGRDFDTAMSQVQATMLKTSDEMEKEFGTAVLTVNGQTKEFEGNLREFAQFLGQSTAYSATEAAEALNFMALAGYNTQQSMDMLPNVLNLAAAGSFDLARASDMVTDTQTAFGISAERTSQMVDEMAKTASISNTSVEQLGDAFLVVGGLAQELGGGMVTLADGTEAPIDNIQELEIALGAMANAGIKGGEAGTHMRNMLLKLASPTDAGAEAFEKLGVSVFDAEGKMKPLAEIMGGLNDGLSNLTQEQKLQAISDIFNTRDTAAAEALLNAVGEDWNKIGEGILDAKDAAADMAAIQLDNLEGDVTLFQSALEGAKIAVSDQLTPSLRQFVQFGTDGLSSLTEAFQKGGMSGAMEEFGNILAKGIDMVVKMLPQAIEAGMKLLGAVGQGILNNLGTILESGKEITIMIIEGLIQAAPSLLDGVMTILESLGGFLIENSATLITYITELIVMMVNMISENAGQMVEGAIALITGISQALIDNLDILLPAIIQMIVAIGLALIQNLPILVQSVIQIAVSLTQTIVNNAPAFLDACLQILVGIGSLIVQYGSQFLSFVGQTLANLLTSVGQGMANIFNTIVNWLAQIPSKMAYYAGYAIGLFIKAVNELPSKIQTILTNVINKITTFATNFANKAKEAATNFFNNIVNGVKELPDKMKKLGDDLVEAVKKLPEKFLDVGKNIVEGLWNGIKNGWTWLTDSVKNLANSLFDGVKDALGIASPSKKFIWVGQMVDEGFAEGVEKYKNLVNGAIKDLVDIPTLNVTGVMESTKGANASGFNQVINITSPVALTPYEVARQTRNATRNMILAMNV